MKFTAIVTALIALVAPAAAFVPTGAARTRGLTTIKMGYVPDGLTPAQYKALKAKEEAQAKANKKKAMVRLCSVYAGFGLCIPFAYHRRSRCTPRPCRLTTKRRDPPPRAAIL